MELKPCPFCGGKEIQFLISGHFQPCGSKGMELWYRCSCYTCGNEMSDGAKTMKEAAEAWNRRADNDESNVFIASMSLADAPTVDAVEVVRCKDCVSHNLCKFEQYLGLDGFCSYGGSKEDETD